MLAFHARFVTFLRRRTWRAMRSAWGVDTLALARTTREDRRAGEREGTEACGRWTLRLPETKAGKEWVAPASAGEASMAHLRAVMLVVTGVRRLTRLMARLILSTISCFFKAVPLLGIIT